MFKTDDLLDMLEVEDPMNDFRRLEPNIPTGL